MSHFVVAVFTHNLDDLDKLLAPYEEYPERPSPYVEFCEDEDGDWDKTVCKTGYWKNKNAKWDWWQVGGRFSDRLRLKPGASGVYEHLSATRRAEQIKNCVCDVARLRDVELGIHKPTYDEAARWWDLVMGNIPDEKDERKLDYHNKDYYLSRYKSRDDYATTQATLTPFAYITPEGEWKAPGRMYMWGMNDVTCEARETYKRELDEFLQKKKDEDMYVVMVDCHI